MHFREIIAKVLTLPLIGDIEEEWKKLHHNAQLTKWPDIDLDDEWELFWDCLGDHVSTCCADMAERISEDFGITTTIYSCGRSGATLYPDGGWCNDYRRNLDISYFDDVYGNWIEAHKKTTNFLGMLKLINEYVKSEAEYIPEWWKDMKECNNWIFGEEKENDSKEIENDNQLKIEFEEEIDTRKAA